MRKFLRACHVISRILIVLSLAAILVLYYYRPDSFAFIGVKGAAHESFWLVFGTTLAMAAVMFAASDWAFTHRGDLHQPERGKDPCVQDAPAWEGKGLKKEST